MDNNELLRSFDRARSQSIESLLEWCRSKRLSLRDDIRNQQEAEWAGADSFDVGEDPGRAALHDAANFVADLGDFSFAQELNRAATEVAGASSLPFLLRVEEWSHVQLSLVSSSDSMVAQTNACKRPAEVARNLKPPVLRGDTAMDIAIVIPLREEFDELHNEIAADCRAERNSNTGAHDYLFSRPTTSGEYRCIVTFVGDMGETKAGLATQQILGKWSPRTVVVLGIAAGISDDVMVGDVVVASVVDSYMQNAKAVESDIAGYVFESSGEPYRPSSAFVKETQHIKYAHRDVYKSWHDGALRDLRAQVNDSEMESLINGRVLRLHPIAEVGHIASGPVVAAAKDFIVEVKKKDRKYLALEMESAGVLAAVHDAADPSHSLVIRGISDLGDGRKSELDSIRNGGLRRYAVRNAIRFLWALMDCEVFPRSEPENPN